MKNTEKILGIKEYYKQNGKLDKSHLAQLTEQFLSSLKPPDIKYEGPISVKIGDTLNFNIKGLPLQNFDFFNGELIETNEIIFDKYPINAIFYGEKGKLRVKAKYNQKLKTLEVDVPKKATNGVLILLCPIKYIFGTFDEMKRMDPKGEYLGRNLRIEKESNIRFDGGNEFCRDIIGLKHSYFTYFRYLSIYSLVIKIQCSPCSVQCPNSAIQFNSDGECYIDPDLCEGEKFLVTDDNNVRQTEIIDGRELWKRFPKTPCWECLTDSPCDRQKIRPVLHHNGICCSDCSRRSRVLGLTLEELCNYGAISVESFSFVVDKTKCQGCFDCYTYLNCYNNICWDTGCNYTTRMVAYIGPSPLTMHLVLKNITFKPQGDFHRGYQLILMIQKDDGNEEAIPFDLGDINSYNFNNYEIEFKEAIYLTLLHGKITIGYPQTITIFPREYDILESEIYHVSSQRLSQRLSITFHTSIGDLLLKGYLFSTYG